MTPARGQNSCGSICLIHFSADCGVHLLDDLLIQPIVQTDSDALKSLLMNCLANSKAMHVGSGPKKMTKAAIRLKS